MRQGSSRVCRHESGGAGESVELWKLLPRGIVICGIAATFVQRVELSTNGDRARERFPRPIVQSTMKLFAPLWVYERCAASPKSETS